MLQNQPESAHWRTLKATLREVRCDPPWSATVRFKFGGFLRRTPSEFGGLFKFVVDWKNPPHFAEIWRTLADSSGSFKSAQIPPESVIRWNCSGLWRGVCLSVADQVAPKLKFKRIILATALISTAIHYNSIADVLAATNISYRKATFVLVCLLLQLTI